jgi:hypothetical protein
MDKHAISSLPLLQFLPKMLSSANAYKISDIQEDEIEAVLTRPSESNNITLVEKRQVELFADHRATLHIHDRGFCFPREVLPKQVLLIDRGKTRLESWVKCRTYRSSSISSSTQYKLVCPVGAHSASAFWAKDDDPSWMEPCGRPIVAFALALWTALGGG